MSAAGADPAPAEAPRSTPVPRRARDIRPASRAALAAWDFACWYAATLVVVVSRYDLSLTPEHWQYALTYPSVVAGAQLVIGVWLGLYRGAAQVGSFLEASRLAVVVGGVSFVACAGFIALDEGGDPHAIPILVPFIAIAPMLGARLVFRAGRRHYIKVQRAAERAPVIVYGAGNAGTQLCQLLAADIDAPYRVVGIIDDDPVKRNLHLGESRVIGTGADLVSRARALKVSTVVLAIARVDTAFMRRLTRELDDADMTLLVLPPVREILGSRLQLDQLHPVDVADLIARTPVEIDLAQVASYLTGKVVLVTGAGGSIGSEIARQVHAFAPRTLVCLDRDESALHAVQLSIYGMGLLDTPDMVLCDIRDLEALHAVFERHRPDVVFHAAALKHLPLLEQYPDEGWKTNVLGTLNVLECAAVNHVERLVNISTDKAADPTSVLGRTKRQAEELTSWFAQNHSGFYTSVRFGNVLGTRGSVLFTFREQIRQGGPVTIVHPEVTRYFMTIPEACQLVIQSGAFGTSGEVYVLDMGEPVKILDVAKRLIRKSGKQVEIVFTGLRPGEKLHETLFSFDESARGTEHPLIRRVQVPATDPGSLRSLAGDPLPSRLDAP